MKPVSSIIRFMSLTEIKSQIDAMSDEDRFLAAAYLQHLANSRDDVYLGELAARGDRIEAGKKFTLEQAVRMHESLEREGW